MRGEALFKYSPDSPMRKSSYASQVTTPPGSLLQHHLMILHSVCICQYKALSGEVGRWRGSVPRVRSDAILVPAARRKTGLFLRRRP